MSQANQQKKKAKTMVLRSGKNPVFGRPTKNGITIAQKIEDKSGIKLYKTDKGIYFSIEIPAENCLKLAYLALRRYLPIAGKTVKPSKGVEEISFDELLKEVKEKKEETREEEEIPFE